MNKKISILMLVIGLVFIIKPIFAGDVSLLNNQLMLTPNHGGDGSAWGQAECMNCHVLRGIHRTAPAIKPIVQNTGYASCAGCHGQNGTAIKRECVLCHNKQLLPKSPIMQEAKNHNFKLEQDSVLTDEDCLACHKSSDMDGKFEPKIDLTHFNLKGLDLPYQSGSDFCLRCHNQDNQQVGYTMQARFERDPLVKMALNYKHLDYHGTPKGGGNRTYTGLRDGYSYKANVECSDCHAMHGTHNEKLIIDRTDAGVSLLNDAIRMQPINVHIEEGNYAQLCVTCHQSVHDVEETNEDAGNGLSGVHQVSGSCLDCHTHGMAAQTGL